MSTVDPKFLGQIRYRCIGPSRGGRVVAVAADPVNQSVFYFGACAGGVWKSDDAGLYWENVSDGQFNTAAIGAMAVAPSDPNVVYAGTGETTIRIDVTHGDGVLFPGFIARFDEAIGDLVAPGVDIQVTGLLSLLGGTFALLVESPTIGERGADHSGRLTRGKPRQPRRLECRRCTHPQRQHADARAGQKR